MHWDGPWYDWRAAVVDNPIIPELISDILSSGVVSTLNVPMSVADKVTGFFTLHFKQRRRFRQDEIALTRAMANQAMLAIQLYRLSAQSRQSAVVAERNRLAREIHDTLAQGFAGIIVQPDAAGDAKSRDMSTEADAHIARASELARDSLGDARRSVQALRPLALEEQTLPLALEEIFFKMTAGTNLRMKFSTGGETRELPPEWDGSRRPGDPGRDRGGVPALRDQGDAAGAAVEKNQIDSIETLAHSHLGPALILVRIRRVPETAKVNLGEMDCEARLATNPPSLEIPSLCQSPSRHLPSKAVPLQPVQNECEDGPQRIGCHYGVRFRGPPGRTRGDVRYRRSRGVQPDHRYQRGDHHPRHDQHLA